jgi:hypothetical protein
MRAIRVARKMMLIGGACLLCAPGPAQIVLDHVPDQYTYGPAPSWERFRELGEEAIRAQLIDPESARFTWDHGFREGGFKPFLTRRWYGYVTCGLVNSRNRFGGYVGRSRFVVVIDNDRVMYSEIGGAGGADLVSAACERAKLPPPPKPGIPPRRPDIML